MGSDSDSDDDSDDDDSDDEEGKKPSPRQNHLLKPQQQRSLPRNRLLMTLMMTRKSLHQNLQQQAKHGQIKLKNLRRMRVQAQRKKKKNQPPRRLPRKLKSLTHLRKALMKRRKNLPQRREKLQSQKRRVVMRAAQKVKR